MRSIVNYFIKYSVSTWVIIFAIAIFGIFGMLSLKSSFFPLSESRIITINLIYPGASPLEMEEGVVLKIEENLKGLQGVERFTSQCFENSAVVIVEAIKGYDPYIVLFDVKNAVDRVPSFPTGMEPPVISKRENIREAITFTVSGDDVPLKVLKNIARQIEYDLRAMDGISQIDISGFPDEEIEIAVREKDLRAYNLTFNQVAQAVASSNILTTGGKIKTDAEEYLIRANNKNYFGDEFDMIIVRTDEYGNTIRLRDIASVNDKWAEDPDRIYYNGNVAVDISVSSTNNEDLIGSAEKTKEYIRQFNAEHSTVQLNVTRDSSITLTQRRQLLQENAMLGILLVLLLLSIFLKPRLALWVAFGLPISFLGMFTFAGFFGVTINVLSLFAMILVIGILVDDAIVVGENIYHHHEKGKTKIRAAIDGTLEVTPPIISAILTTVIAFSTFLFLDGRMGDNFSQVAIIVSLILLVSLFEALVILPSHIAHSRALDEGQKTFFFNRWGDQLISFLRDKLYVPYLRFFVHNRFLGIVIPISFLLLTIGALRGGIIRTTFFPNIASDRIVVDLQMPKGTSEQITTTQILKIENAVWKVNEAYTEKQTGKVDVVDNVITRIGPGTSTASVRVNLLPGDKRDFSADELTNALRSLVADSIVGEESLTFGSGSRFGGKPVSVSLVGYNIEELKAATEMLKQKMNQHPQLKDVIDSDPEGIKEIKIQLKENAYMLGLSYSEIMSQVRSAFFGRQVQRLQRGQDEVRIWVRYHLADRKSINNLDDMRIVTPKGERVPLKEIVDYEIKRGEVAINHIDGKREIQVSADLNDPKDSPIDIIADLKEGVLKEVFASHPTVSALYEGQNREAVKVGRSARAVVPVVLFLIFAIIAFTFRSYSQPLILMLMIPFSLIGVAWGHYLHDNAVSILSTLGIIALIGIVVNDGLVLITKFNKYLKEGMKYNDALIEAGKSRFRAIFLTSMTTVAGLSPLIFEKSRQAQFLIPMALSIVYGIILATFLTLLLLPLLLSVSNSMKVYLRWLWTGVKPSRESVERAVKEINGENHD
jgi:multidrug efflux pump subunit AcrB